MNTTGGGIDATDTARGLEIEASALDLLDDLSIGAPPVNVILVAQQLGIEVLVAMFKEDGIAGMVHRSGTSGERAGQIWVNRLDAPVRRRFTVAHEIGHWRLGHLGVGGTLTEPAAAVAYRSAEGAFAPREVEANRFAAALLMPAPRVNALLESRITEESVLAGMFDVSGQAMQIRLEEVRRMTGPAQ